MIFVYEESDLDLETGKWIDPSNGMREDALRFYKLNDSDEADFGDDIELIKYCFGIKGLT